MMETKPRSGLVLLGRSGTAPGTLQSIWEVGPGAPEFLYLPVPRRVASSGVGTQSWFLLQLEPYHGSVELPSSTCIPGGLWSGAGTSWGHAGEGLLELTLTHSFY